MWGYIKHAWQNTFSNFGGFGFILTVIAIPVVGLALHYRQDGYDAMIPEFDVWFTYVLQATGLVFSAVFLWNLACSPYRIEREKRIELERHLAKFAPLDREIDWTAWRIRKQFTVGELGYIMSGVEPSAMPASGAAQAYTQEIIWDIQAEKLKLILGEHQALLRSISIPLSGPMHVGIDDKVGAKAFRDYLSKRNDQPSRIALANLGEDDPSQLQPDTEVEKLPKTPRD
jgi:hypothetical protein